MRKKHLLKKINNKGETMILVVVAVGIILLLGASILYATYTAYMIRNTERRSEDVFSSADTGMDLIKNRLGEAESLAAETGYSKLLNLYSGYTESDQQYFTTSFHEGLSDVCVNSTGQMSGDAKTGYRNLFLNNLSRYDTEAIEYLLHGRQQAGDDEFQITGNGAVSQSKDGSVVLKDLTLTYLRKKDGYKTSVTTDIRLKVPDVSFLTPGSGTAINALENFTCVADKGLYLYDITKSGGGNGWANKDGAKFDGSVYAGEVHVTKQVLDVNSGNRVIIGRTQAMQEDAEGNVSVDPNGKKTSGELIIDNQLGFTGGGVNVHNGGTLWTQDINLKNGGSINAESGSNVYVADDLSFGEGGGNATISGNYVGFGNKDISGESSSIVFNQKKGSWNNKSNLDLTNLSGMILAGRTFVMESNDTSDANTDSKVGMGSSITAKPEQLAYLIPSGDDSILGSISNPRVIDNNTADKEAARAEAVDQVEQHKDDKVNNMSRPLSDYGIGDADSVEVLSYPSTDKTTVTQYYFFKFNSQANANAYFKDYFENNADQINDYISQYSDIKGLDSSKITSASTGLNGSEGSYSASDAETDTENLKKITDKYQTRYENLSQTLDEKRDNGWTSTPFYTMINTDELHAMCGNRRSGDRYPAAWWGDLNDYTVYDNHLNYVSDDTTPVYSDDGNKILLVVGKTYYYKQNGTTEKIARSGPAHLTDEERTKTKVAGYVAWPEKGQPFVMGDGYGHNDDDFYIVDGDVKIMNEFNGLIMSSGIVSAGQGTLHLKGGIGARALVHSHIYRKNSKSGGISDTEDWSLNKMVTYENWRKNG